MDGVLHRFGTTIPGASEFMTMLNAGQVAILLSTIATDFVLSQVPYMLLTNECRYTAEDLSRKLLGILGVSIPVSQIYTAANSKTLVWYFFSTTVSFLGAADFFHRLMANGWTGMVYIVGEVRYSR